MPGVREVLRRVKKLEITTDRMTEGLVAGSYRSAFKGRGIEFSEVRDYAPGDDVRSIDWKVTARFNHPFVKEYVEERDLDVYVVFDVSGSTYFGSSRQKRDVGVEIAASLMFASLRNNDSVGLILFTDRVEKFIPPKKGRRHVLRLIRELVYYEPQRHATDLSKALEYIRRIAKKRGVIIVISDFMGYGYDRPLRMLKRRHDVVLINLTDAMENDLASLGYMLLEDAETGEQMLVDTSDPLFLEAYQKESSENNSSLKERIKRLGVDMVDIPTHEPFHEPIKRFFAMKGRRL